LTVDGLAQPAVLYMPYLDDARIEDEHVGWMTRDIIRDNLPFNRALCGIEITIFVDIQPEFWESDEPKGVKGASRNVLTVITKEEFIVAGAE
jgi:hypothetical protein